MYKLKMILAESFYQLLIKRVPHLKGSVVVAQPSISELGNFLPEPKIYLFCEKGLMLPEDKVLEGVFGVSDVEIRFYADLPYTKSGVIDAVATLRMIELRRAGKSIYPLTLLEKRLAERFKIALGLASLKRNTPLVLDRDKHTLSNLRRSFRKEFGVALSPEFLSSHQTVAAIAKSLSAGIKESRVFQRSRHLKDNTPPRRKVLRDSF